MQDPRREEAFLISPRASQQREGRSLLVWVSIRAKIRMDVRETETKPQVPAQLGGFRKYNVERLVLGVVRLDPHGLFASKDAAARRGGGGRVHGQPGVAV